MSSSTVPAFFATTPERQAFYTSLSPKDRVVHDLAIRMLKTRYTPERTNAWAEWLKKQQGGQKQ
jgi:hypothetical protein